MAHPSVVEAVEQRIKAGFSACPIYVENEITDDPDHGAPWIVIDFPWCRSTWITADEFEEEGGFRVLLALNTGIGAAQGRQWLDQIASLFRGQQFDGVQCFAPQSPMTNDRSDQANHFRLEITVPYRTVIEG